MSISGSSRHGRNNAWSNREQQGTVVARMERSAIREDQANRTADPHVASLYAGYDHFPSSSGGGAIRISWKPFACIA
jgi:hypothetical protein